MFIISKKAGKKGFREKKKLSQVECEKKMWKWKSRAKGECGKALRDERDEIFGWECETFFLLLFFFLLSTSFGCKETIKEWFSISE